MPDFKNMTAAELSVWYVKNVGYDIGAEDPAMSLQSYRELCIELYELHNESDTSEMHMGVSSENLP